MLPRQRWGATSAVRVHIADWYMVFCRLSGLSAEQCADDAAEPPRPLEEVPPGGTVWGRHSWPGLDAVDAWPALLEPGAAVDAVHPQLVVSSEVLLRGDMKLLLGQSSTSDGGRKIRHVPHPPGVPLRRCAAVRIRSAHTLSD